MKFPNDARHLRTDRRSEHRLKRAGRGHALGDIGAHDLHRAERRSSGVSPFVRNDADESEGWQEHGDGQSPRFARKATLRGCVDQKGGLGDGDYGRLLPPVPHLSAVVRGHHVHPPALTLRQTVAANVHLEHAKWKLPAMETA